MPTFNVITPEQAVYLATLIVTIVGVLKVYLPQRGGYSNNVRLFSVLTGAVVTVVAALQGHSASVFVPALGDGITLGGLAAAGVAVVKATQSRFSASTPAAKPAPEQAAA